MRTRFNHNGFTLIELIIVVIVLGIISVLALPRFLNIQDNAATSTVQGVAGSLHSSLQLANARVQIDEADTTIEYSGETITLVAGMPQASAGSLRALLEIDVPATWTPDWETVPCDEQEFCILGNMNPGKPGYVAVPGYTLVDSGDNASYIWPKGYILESNGCYAFYINEASQEKYYSGAVTDGC
jgi:MSHA pilin protein MshA